MITVSYWYVPGGYDYSNAVIVEKLFETQQEAEEFVLEYRNPPEMAMIICRN